MDAIKIYSFLHVAAGFHLTALTFAACAAPDPEKRKRSPMLTGILSRDAGRRLRAGGPGLRQPGLESWMFVKIACWLGLSALAGIAYRKPEKAGGLMLLGTVLVLVAVGTAYFMR